MSLKCGLSFFSIQRRFLKLHLLVSSFACLGRGEQNVGFEEGLVSYGQLACPVPSVVQRIPRCLKCRVKMLYAHARRLNPRESERSRNSGSPCLPKPSSSSCAKFFWSFFQLNPGCAGSTPVLTFHMGLRRSTLALSQSRHSSDWTIFRHHSSLLLV